MVQGREVLVCSVLYYTKSDDCVGANIPKCHVAPHGAIRLYHGKLGADFSSFSMACREGELRRRSALNDDALDVTVRMHARRKY